MRRLLKREGREADGVTPIRPLLGWLTPADKDALAATSRGTWTAAPRGCTPAQVARVVAAGAPLLFEIIDARHGAAGETRLGWAARTGKAARCAELASWGADVDAASLREFTRYGTPSRPAGCTPLMAACAGGHVDAVAALLAAGADAADVAADSAADATTIDGWVTQRVVRRGEVLREPAIARPQLIKSGSAVHVQASVDGVLVSRDGTALNTGSLGDQVRVRLDAQRTITGIVAGPATVKLP